MQQPDLAFAQIVKPAGQAVRMTGVAVANNGASLALDVVIAELTLEATFPIRTIPAEPVVGDVTTNPPANVEEAPLPDPVALPPAEPEVVATPADPPVAAVEDPPAAPVAAPPAEPEVGDETTTPRADPPEEPPLRVLLPGRLPWLLPPERRLPLPGVSVDDLTWMFLDVLPSRSHDTALYTIAYAQNVGSTAGFGAVDISMPEPGALALLALGGALLLRRKRRL